MAFTMTKLEALGEYERNKGLSIMVGRKKVIPQGLEGERDMILMGDCIKGLRKKIDKAGGEYLFVPGCPPVEGFPYWTIVDREEQPSAKVLEDLGKARQRNEDEGKKLAAWLEHRRKD